MGEHTKLEAADLGREANGRWLFSDISLTLSAGEQLALVGPSGSGKTLLLRSLALLDPLDAGEVRWRGQRVVGAEIPRFRSQVMYLHQQPALPEGTVERILSQPFTLKIHSDKQFDQPRIIELLELLGRKSDFLSKQQTSLSGGEAQLTSLLRAIQLDPIVLLLDEPTSALDDEATELVERLVSLWLEQRSDERACIWVTHDGRQADRVADSLRYIRDGRLYGEK